MFPLFIGGSLVEVDLDFLESPAEAEDDDGF